MASVQMFSFLLGPAYGWSESVSRFVCLSVCLSHNEDGGVGEERVVGLHYSVNNYWSVSGIAQSRRESRVYLGLLGLARDYSSCLNI
jgi:hypothetical protein